MSEVKVNKISPRTNCGTTQLGDAGDTITVTGDLKSNSLKSASGSTITLGQSGDTIQLGCGASQTGFGRTGTVDWDTTAKTASFTAVSGNGYFVNTTSGAITVTLPATPSAGDIVAIADYAGTANTNNITIARNGSLIEGDTQDATIFSKRDSITLVYVDGTQGWVAVNDNTGEVLPPLYVTASGGTVTTCGDYKIHTFTSPGTFCVSCAGNACGSNTVDYLVVAGGGGGSGNGGYGAGSRGAGAGGAGGVRLSATTFTNSGPSAPRSACVSALPVPATSYPITVGGGGAAGNGADGSQGSNSIFSTITSAGGGRGGGHCDSFTGAPGGSGGSGANTSTGASGNSPPVSPPQGSNAGNGGASNGNFAGGGGGGFMAVGGNGNPGGSAGSGGAGGGWPNAFGTNGQPSGGQYYMAGGGGGGAGNQTGSGGTGGIGGGGNGKNSSPYVACSASYFGSGGGGSGHNPGSTSSGGSGSGGIVVIRYKYQN